MLSYIPINSYSHIKSKNPMNGTKMYQVPLKWILEYCLKRLDPMTPKHEDGVIFSYIGEVSGITDNSISGGIMFLDIDHLKRKHAETIFNSFGNICTYFPALCGIQYSSSYYLKKDRDDTGLHIYIKTEPLTRAEYPILQKLGLACLSEVILKVCNIDLLEEERLLDEKILDTKVSNLAHRLFLHYSEYNINPYASEFKEDSIKESDKKALIKKYDILKGIYKKTGEIKKFTHTEFSGSYTYNAGVITPKYFHHDDLITIANTLHRVGKSFDEIFEIICAIQSDHEKWENLHNRSFESYAKNIAGVAAKQNISQETFDRGVKYLASCGINILDAKPWYISQEKKRIIEEIEKGGKFQIVAPTGSGKSTLIAELAEKYNGVIIVPYLATTKLYEEKYHLKIITSNNRDEYNPSMPCVMVWDQAIHFNFRYRRVVFLDESHELFLERDFRERAIILMNQLKGLDNLICVTATPADEAKILGIENILKFNNKRKKDVNTIFYIYEYRSQMILSIQKEIEKLMLGESKYDKIVVMMDNIVRLLFDLNKDYEDNICYFRADTRNFPECKEMLETEFLTKKLTLSTNIGFNALNFRNENEKILLINHLDTHCRIIQQAGRFRNTDITMRCYVPDDNGDGNDIIDINDKIEYHSNASEYVSETDADIICNEKYNDESFQKAKKEIDKWEKENSQYELVEEKLQETGYFKLFYEVNIHKSSDLQSTLKKDLSNKIINGEKIDFQNLSINEKRYYLEMKDEIDNFCWNRGLASLLDDEDFLNINIFETPTLLRKTLQSFHKNTLITSQLNLISKIQKISNMDDASFEKEISLIENWIKKIEKLNLTETGKLYYTKQNQKKIKEYKTIKKKNYPKEFNDILNQLINENELENLKIKEKNSIGGKKRKQEITIVNNTTNEEKTFPSNEDCRAFLKMPSATYQKWKKGFSFKTSEYNTWRLKC